MSRRELFSFLREQGIIHPTKANSRQMLIDYVQSTLHLEEDTDIFKKVVSNFTSSLSDKWSRSQRNVQKFNKKYEKWLDERVSFSEDKTPIVSNSKKPGRPCKSFEVSSARSKRKKVSNLIQTASTSELSLAIQIKLRKSGHRGAASLINEVTSFPNRASKIKKTIQTSQVKGDVFTPEEALALIIDLKLTKHAYIELRKRTLQKQSNIFPSYNRVKKVKEACYPAKDAIQVTDVSAEVRLQDLVNLTVNRLLIAQEQVIGQCLSEIDISTIEMVYKWGMDGSSGQKQYKQKLNADGSTEYDDSNLFVCSMVPIQLKSFRKNNKEEEIILWQNPRVSSTRYCRPIHFQCKKETVELTKQEIHHIQEQINQIQPTNKQIGDMHIKVNHIFHMTMIDGKVCNSLTDTSSQVCYICGASPKNMNDLENITKRAPNVHTYSFGLSTLHTWIRFFECLIHISYRLDLKKWQVRGAEEKQILLNRKQHVINRFRNETGLVVDQPKQSFGTSNDGNTARRFFENPKKSAEITGIDEILISRFSTILHTLSSGYEINIEKFNNYSNETAKMFIDLYGWYYMPASVHKVLLHGGEVVRHFLIPIGQLSEDAQEARNKDFRSYREHHTRKTSRSKTNEDILNRLLISSDPLISSIRPLPRKKAYVMSEEVRSMLVCPKIVAQESDPKTSKSNSESSDGSDSDSEREF